METHQQKMPAGFVAITEENLRLKRELDDCLQNLKNIENILNNSNSFVFSSYFITSSELYLGNSVYFTNLLGYGKDEKPGFSFNDLMSRLHPDDLLDFRRMMDVLYNKKAKCFMSIFRLMNKEGNYIRMLGKITFAGIDEMTGSAALSCIVTVFPEKSCPPREIDALNKDLQFEKTKEMKHKLTQHEIDIMRLIGDGLTWCEIIQMLHISKSTFDSTKHNILNKTGTRNSPELVKFYYTHGLY